ncbi:MAG: AmmeMemoRadiSam system protein A [Anaerolinea sp.]|nr:AmmeMemoRadiSam system protein A [Anaerolinea sp.]
MPSKPLTQQEKRLLLVIARQAMENAVRKQLLDEINLTSMPISLQEPGASFVTLTVGDALRGCIGTLEAHQPLALDVQEHAVAAALEDYRFTPVIPAELKHIHIEVSRLTPAIPLEYADPLDLLCKLRPGEDGVILKDGPHRATFLPQVWEKVPDPAEFLDQLCYKMGALPEVWRNKHPQVFTYQVEEFHE